MRDDSGVLLGLTIGVFLGIFIGCGSVSEQHDVDAADGSTAGASGHAGASGAAGTTGIAGAGVDAGGGAAGSPGRPLGAGCTSDDQCGSQICDGATAACCDGRPDACNTCIGGYLTPKTDGTACNTSTTVNTCDGVAPFVGQHACTARTHACQAGTCTVVETNCCTMGGCPSGQQHACSGAAEDPSQPTYCTVCV